MLDNETDGGSDENHNDEVENQVPAHNAEIEALKLQNAEILNSLKALQQAQNQPKEDATKKVYTAEEFKALQESNPEAAMEHVISKKLDAKVQGVETKLTSQQQQAYYDSKADQDFPLLKTDPKFNSEVKKEIQALIAAGMPKESPKLVYTAAEIAALKYQGAKNTEGGSKPGISGEPPRNIKKENSKAPADDKTFNRFAEAFGLSDKAKELARRNIQINKDSEAHRKGRG